MVRGAAMCMHCAYEGFNHLPHAGCNLMRFHARARFAFQTTFWSTGVSSSTVQSRRTDNIIESTNHRARPPDPGFAAFRSVLGLDGVSDSRRT